MMETKKGHSCPVHSYNEWDPLEEVIIGHLAGAAPPVYHKVLEAVVPPEMVEVIKQYNEPTWPAELLEEAEKQRQAFIHILKSEGVVVREPEPMDFTQTHATPFWQTHGECATCPRDSLLVIGNEIIEAPMSWRSRYFETFPYRPIVKEYFRRGAKWTAAPKPQLKDAVYNYDYQVPQEGEPMRYVINEEEPLFDAADFMRFGKDILAVRSNTSNEAGITWLERHLGEEYTIHRVKSKFRQPMHLDDQLMPLAPGKLLISPEYIDENELPEFLKSWEILKAPKPDPVDDSFFSAESIGYFWLNINVLVLDHERLVVEASQTSTIKALKDWGFKPIPCSFMKYADFGGLFHCATVDIRRRHSIAY